MTLLRSTKAISSMRASDFSIGLSKQLRSRCLAVKASPRGRVAQCLRLTTATTCFTTSAIRRSRAPPTCDELSPEVLEPYTPPTTGILSRLPPSLVPYGELMRMDKPAGTTYLFIPCALSTILAAMCSDPIVPPSTVISTIALFYAGAWVMRGAGCTVNDLWDRNLDPKVARTRLRPVARGAVTVPQALGFLGLQLTAGLGILLQFPSACFYYAVPSLLLVTLYPLAKRVTHYPQVVLGFTFSWGAIMGYPALGLDLLSNAPALYGAASLYLSCVVWTLFYDMIYAFQDIKDDAKAGIKSIAQAYQHTASQALLAFGSVQTVLFGIATFLGGGSYTLAGISWLALALQLQKVRKAVDLKDTKSCAMWFKKGAWLVGGTMIGVLGVDYALQYAAPDRLVALNTLLSSNKSISWAKDHENAKV